MPLGVADIVRAGKDVTVVATQQMRYRALDAAEQLQANNIDVEVIDPRTLVPFDDRTVIESLSRTSRLVVVQEAPVDGSWGASLIARIVTEDWSLLDAPPALVAADATPIPYAANLEAMWLPSVDTIVEAVEKTVSY